MMPLDAVFRHPHSGRSSKVIDRIRGAEGTHSPFAHLLLKGVAPGLWITSARPLGDVLNKFFRVQFRGLFKSNVI